MKNHHLPDLIITGLGITSPIGQGKTAFTTALMQGHHAFGVMQRAGRQKDTEFLGAELPALTFPEQFPQRLLRTLTLSGQAALVTLHEAWNDAQLAAVDPQRIGLVVGGSNLQQRTLLQTYEAYSDRIDFLRPTFGFSFMDSDLCGLCTEQFNIQGSAYTLGSASASGQAAILQAMQNIQTGQVDVCIALGALLDLSYLECQALRTLGAMGSDRYADNPDLACRPFDAQHDGFIYGENCGAVVIERANTDHARSVSPYASILGGAMTMDGNRNPNPSYQGEVRAIQMALAQANISANQIDYINPHGTGSLIGDETEINAIIDCQLAHASINTTKSLTGHGLSAAGTVELIATLIQMEAQQLHPSRNLKEPIQADCNWVREKARPQIIEHALTLSMGFGGVNTAICLKR
ncbi:beta-ketoacyl synthase N-terminal-like domain-containing protein [Dictyobacter arantiisoli]|uniref:Polyketide biosynthesis malonyl-ACP decarboxylase PksF n=1 Tax=Dictyobacter arantiisoli TaxID=2014874 RepID=A0A5A5T6Q0_9CHLR|nr:beta-ketoacyl synthase N-terminal-like domain-containing protein [Dictyobacter arantiisoli]GCF07150.1 polyketide biosynthesis malonyl-ACP decarboxylase PksF [Dictyobacter arantiisoli]